jgi:hypothetical protein
MSERLQRILQLVSQEREEYFKRGLSIGIRAFEGILLNSTDNHQILREQIDKERARLQKIHDFSPWPDV